MGCDEIQDNYDYKINNFFISKNEEEEFDAFLINSKSIPGVVKQSKSNENKILNFITDNIEKIEIISDYEECKAFSNKKGNEIFIVSADYLKKICNDLDKIKDKKVIVKKIKKKRAICEEENENDKKIQFTTTENGFYTLIGEFNPSSVLSGKYDYYIIYK